MLRKLAAALKVDLDALVPAPQITGASWRQSAACDIDAHQDLPTGQAT